MERFIEVVFLGWNSGGSNAGHWVAGFFLGSILGGYIEKLAEVMRKKSAADLEAKIKSEVDKRVAAKVNNG